MAKPNPAQYPGSELVARIRVGDEQAFEALFREYYQPLRRYAITIVHRPDVAEDIVQAIFLRLWTGRHEWVLRVSLKAYLYSAVHHRALQLLRHERVHDRHVIAVLESGDDAEASPQASWPDAQLTDQELNQVVQAVLKGLGPRTRQAFELRRYHQLSYQEIADVMGISVKTVGVHIGRALAVLRKAMIPYLAAHVLLVL